MAHKILKNAREAHVLNLLVYSTWSIVLKEEDIKDESEEFCISMLKEDNNILSEHQSNAYLKIVQKFKEKPPKNEFCIKHLSLYSKQYNEKNLRS